MIVETGRRALATMGAAVLAVACGSSEATAIEATAQKQSEPRTDGGASPRHTGVAGGTTPSTPADFALLDGESATRFALDMIRLSGDFLYIDGPELGALIEANTTPEGFEQISAVITEEIAPVRIQLAALEPETVWAIIEPLSSSATITGEQAEVEVWATRIFSRVGAYEPEVRFATYTLRLQQNTDRWLVDSWAWSPGPTPRLGFDAQPATALDIDTYLDGHRLIDDGAQRRLAESQMTPTIEGVG